jgi:lipid-A-disaccharide synthase
MNGPQKKFKVLVSAGDPSGDLILAAVIRELKALNPNFEFVGLCGPASVEAGAVALASSADIAVVGIWEVLGSLGKIFGVLGRLEQELDSCQSVLCVDFPDFNLKLAQLAKRKNKFVDYIIAPQVWAWRSSRMVTIRERVRRLYPALPFEESLFRDQGVDAKFMGHPIRDLLPPKNRKSARAEFQLLPDDFALLMMPGSRKSEIKVQMPLMLEAWNFVQKFSTRYPSSMQLSKWKVIVPLAPGWNHESFFSLLPSKTRKKIDLLQESGTLQFTNQGRSAMMASDFGWITSGTATLEAAYYQLPHILLYKLSQFSAYLIRQSSRYFSDPDSFAGLPNILLGKKVVPELLQNDLNPRRLALESLELLQNSAALSQMRKELRYLPKSLGEVGATGRMAQDLFKLWGMPS